MTTDVTIEFHLDGKKVRISFTLSGKAKKLYEAIKEKSKHVSDEELLRRFMDAARRYILTSEFTSGLKQAFEWILLSFK